MNELESFLNLRRRLIFSLDTSSEDDGIRGRDLGIFVMQKVTTDGTWCLAFSFFIVFSWFGAGTLAGVAFFREI